MPLPLSHSCTLSQLTLSAQFVAALVRLGSARLSSARLSLPRLGSALLLFICVHKQTAQLTGSAARENERERVLCKENDSAVASGCFLFFFLSRRFCYYASSAYYTSPLPPSPPLRCSLSFSFATTEISSRSRSRSRAPSSVASVVSFSF